MTNTTEAQEFIDGMAASRGYALDYHKLLAHNDLESLKAVEGMVQQVYLSERHLSKATKELLYILSMTCLRLPSNFIEAHVRRALEYGVSNEEILEALEMAIPEAGVPTFEHGLTAWANVVGAERVEPSTLGS